MHNTEDKGWWVEEYGKKELEFVTEVCPRLGLSATINPAKESDPFAPDLIVDGVISDLKCQQTPFFKAQQLYRIDPQFAVTFNKKDYSRYSNSHPQIHVYFWVDWKKLEMSIRGQSFSVTKMEGVWRARFSAVKLLVDSGAKLHDYQRRRTDKVGNARDSYLLDVREFDELMLVQG